MRGACLSVYEQAERPTVAVVYNRFVTVLAKHNGDSIASI